MRQHSFALVKQLGAEIWCEEQVLLGGARDHCRTVGCDKPNATKITPPSTALTPRGFVYVCVRVESTSVRNRSRDMCVRVSLHVCSFFNGERYPQNCTEKTQAAI